MTIPDQLRALIERLEKAEGPHYVLEGEIWAMVNSGNWAPQTTPPNYTASLDAALTLVPEGWRVHEFQQGDDRLWRCKVVKCQGQGGSSGHQIYALPAALALCIAALRARLSLLESDELIDQRSNRPISQEANSHELAREWEQTVQFVRSGSASHAPLVTLVAQGDRMAAKLNRLKAANDEHEALFNMQWDADQRAIKMWHEAGGDELVWPDSADLTVWLLEQLRDANGEIEALKQDMESMYDSVNSEANEVKRLRKSIETWATAIREHGTRVHGDQGPPDAFLHELADEMRAIAEPANSELAARRGVRPHTAGTASRSAARPCTGRSDNT